MAMAETERAELVQTLVTTIGERPAENLMSSILPDGRDHLATKPDIQALEAKVDGGFARIDGEFAKVDAGFAKVDAGFAKVDGRFTSVDGRFTSVDGEFAKVYGVIEGLKGHFDLKLANQTRTMLLAMLACMVATWAGMLAGFLTLASMISG